VKAAGAPKIKCTHKGPEQNSNAIKDAGLAMAIASHQHRQILLERHPQIVEAAEVLDVKLADQHGDGFSSDMLVLVERRLAAG
jgi:hypothetical protein